MTFGRELYVEQDDFMEHPPKKFYRLSPGKEVRLRYGYFVTCQEVVKDAAGAVVALRCTYDPASKGGNSPDGRKVQATLHWVAAADAVPAEIRLYSHLFNRPDPGADGDVLADLNPDSLEVLTGCLVEPGLRPAPVGRGGAVRTARLFLRSIRNRSGAAGVQSDGRTARYVGEGSGGAEGSGWGEGSGRREGSGGRRPRLTLRSNGDGIVIETLRWTAREQVADHRGRHGLAEQEALHLLAAFIVQEAGLFFVLDAFGVDADAHGMAHPHHRGQSLPRAHRFPGCGQTTDRS